VIWFGIVLAIALTAALSAARSALVNVRHARLHQLHEAGVAGAERAERVAENSSRLLATIQVSRMLVMTAAIVIATVGLMPDLTNWLGQWPALQPAAPVLAATILVVASAFVLLWLGDLLPATLAARQPERLALIAALPIEILGVVFSPFVSLISRMAGLVTIPTGNAAPMAMVTEEEIKTLVDAGEETGEIEEDEKEMIYSVFEFGETMAREVMVPRVDMLALSVETALPDATDRMIAAGHSRVPVYEGSIDNVVGLLYAKDLLRLHRQGFEQGSLRDLLRPAYFVPEAKKIDELLKELQLRKTHMAVVVDEYGGVAGLITVEDILEELVGELQDEYDFAEEPESQQVGPGEYIFAGRVSLDEVSEVMETALDPELGDTLGGFIYSQLGKVPVAGEQLHVNGLHMEIVDVKGRRIHKVRVRRETAQGQNEA
jgi:CBS domain containing-hemolysin-like protein